MRMSCNGCRVLRKGCGEFCVFRPCLQWIRTPESQENAITFLAKFYGRAGLTNLISRAPEQLRPDIFKSLLYDACGRMVNPIYGSLGLLLSGNWTECQAAVDSILRGSLPASTRGNFVSPTPSIMLQMEGMAGLAQHKAMKCRGRGRFKGFSGAKPKRKERENVTICNHYRSNGKFDDRDSVKDTLQNFGNGKFNGEDVEAYSTFLTRQEKDEFHVAQEQVECGRDLSFEYNKAETPACNAVELELTLGSRSSTSPRRISAVDMPWGEARWDHCMGHTYLP
eukprot:PITA_17960